MNSKPYHFIPWAWSLAWLLTGLGTGISEIYSSPNRGLAGYLILTTVGWCFAGYLTSRAAWGKPALIIRLLAWVLATIIYIWLGLVWLYTWNVGFLGLPVATGLAGALGAVASSARRGVWRYLSALLVGLFFLTFATAGFYLSYFLLNIGSMVSGAGGYILFSYVAWILPNALFGLGAGFAIRWILGLNTHGPEVSGA